VLFVRDGFAYSHRPPIDDMDQPTHRCACSSCSRASRTCFAPIRHGSSPLRSGP
jgi:hypothetical protein